MQDVRTKEGTDSFARLVHGKLWLQYDMNRRSEEWDEQRPEKVAGNEQYKMSCVTILLRLENLIFVDVEKKRKQ